MKEMTPAEALHRAAAYCSKSEHCTYEVFNKLMQWGIDEKDAAAIISHLLKEKFIDDARFCRSFINDKYKYNRWGRIKIIYELRQKRIEESVYLSALDETINDELYLENLTSLLQEKKRTIKGDNPLELKAKLFRFATGRGFESADISQALKQIK